MNEYDAKYRDKILKKSTHLVPLELKERGDFYVWGSGSLHEKVDYTWEEFGKERQEGKILNVQTKETRRKGETAEDSFCMWFSQCIYIVKFQYIQVHSDSGRQLFIEHQLFYLLEMLK